MTESRKNLIWVLAVVVLLAMPAGSVRLISAYYDAPNLQPFGITRESLAATSQGFRNASVASIDVQVRWGREWPGAMTQTGLRERITATLEYQTEYFHFDFNEQPGQNVDITFVVGNNSFGPFPPSRMLKGMEAALFALRMTNKRAG